MGEAYITKNFEKFAREFAQSMYFEKFPNHNKLMEYFNFDILDDDCQKEKFGKYDHALFIFDRDYWEVQPFGESDEQHEKQSHTSYEVLLKSLSDYGCTAALSTPFFEFWLLLHHWNEELSKIEYKPYLDGSKNIITNRLKRIEKWSEKDNGKVLTDERKRFYGKNFEKALNALLNSSKFSKEPEDLIRNVGSNVGIVLKNWM